MFGYYFTSIALPSNGAGPKPRQSLIRISLIRVVLLPLPVSEFIIFQPILGSVTLQASIFCWYYCDFSLRISVFTLFLADWLSFQWLCKPSLCRRHLEVVDTRKNGRAKIFYSIFLWQSLSFITFFMSDVSHDIDDCLTGICLIGAWGSKIVLKF